MTSRDISWVQAASITLKDSASVWMTAPELVREIESRDIKNIRTTYGQSVRTLRTALNINSRKPKSQFLKREGESGVTFALKRRCESPSSSLVLFQASQHVPTPRNQKSHKQQHKKPLLPITNGLGQDPLLPPFTPPSLTNNNLSSSVSCSLLTTSQSFYSTPIIPETLTVEIDPNSRGSRTTLGLERSSCVCLPSPVSSILGPMRTLQILTESSELEDQRPVRQVRKRRAKESTSEAPLSPLVNGYSNEGVLPLSCPTAPEVLHLETCHSLSSHLFEVACVRPLTRLTSSSGPQRNASTYEDPCTAQGDRSFCASFEIDPKPLIKKRRKTIVKYEVDIDPVSFVTQASSSESDLESDLSDVQFQSRPTSQLLVRRLSQHKQHPLSMDLSQGSMSEMNDDEEDDDVMGDLDVDYLEPRSSNYRRSREVMKRRIKMRRRAAVGRTSKADSRRTCLGELGEESADKRMETVKKNISVLFLPQSPLVSENMKV